MEATFQLPPRKNLAEILAQEPALSRSKAASFASGSPTKQPRKAGTAWTEEEHLAFLEGLQKLGKGNWRGISKFYVPSRSSTQVASHAQKYMQRITGATKRKSKFSDIEQQADALLAEQRAQRPAKHYSPDPSLHCQSAPTNLAASEAERSWDGSMQRSFSSSERLQAVHRPRAVRVHSERDLHSLAESLNALKERQHTNLHSSTSAFKLAHQDRRGSASLAQSSGPSSQQVDNLSTVTSRMSHEGKHAPDDIPPAPLQAEVSSAQTRPQEHAAQS